MARRTDDILYGITGQTLLLRVPQGRPTSATFKVFDDTADDDGSPEFSGSATVDAVNTTLDGAAGPLQSDPQNIPLTSTSGIEVGRRYLVSQNARKEWVDPIAVISGDSVAARYQLDNEFTSGALFQSTYLTAAVNSTWIATEANISEHGNPDPDWRVRWEITVGGIVVVVYSFFDVVRALPGSGISFDDLDFRWPGLKDSIPLEQRTDRGAAMIGAAERRVRARLATVKLDDDGIRDQEAVDEFTLVVLRRLLAEGGMHPAGFSAFEYLEFAIADESRFFEQHFQVVLSHPVDKGTGGDANSKRAVPLWVK